MNRSLPFFVIPALALAACGGSGSNSVSFAEIQDRADGLDTLAVTSAANLPVSGTATYSGIAIAVAGDFISAPDDVFAAAGAAELRADFSAGTVTGTANNFYQIDVADDNPFENGSEERISGSIDFNLNQETNGQNLYLGETDGRLRATDNTVYNFDLPAAGGFFGTNAQQFSLEAVGRRGNTAAALNVIAQ